MKELIKKIVEVTGPSGYEYAIREKIEEEIKEYADEIKVDALGNLIVRKGKLAENGKKIMIAGHMDEIGIMVTLVDENGFLRFTPIGGLYPQTLYGGRVRFMNGTIGAIGMEKLEDRGKVSPIDKLYIDVGASSAENCPVKVGDAGGILRDFVDQGDVY